MEIKVLTNSELIKFVESNVFSQLVDVPITPLRAISQYHNPKAKPDDPVLIIAFNEDQEVIAYVGCLPDQLALAPEEKICWNSCWWTHPEKGKGASMPVFYKALQLWNAKMLFDGLPARSEAILRSLKFVHFEKIIGLRGFLRSKFHQIILNRKPELKPFQVLFKFFDGGINLLLTPRFYLWKKRLEQSKLIIERIERVHSEVDQFIQQQSRKQLIQRTANDLNWILDNPWLDQEKNKNAVFQKRYFFSAHTERFESHLFKIKNGDQLVAFVFLSDRDGTITLPYFYCLSDHVESVSKIILHQLLLLKATTFLCYQTQLVPYFQKDTNPFFYAKKMSKTVGIPDALKIYFDQTPMIQDGDGDVVFT